MRAIILSAGLGVRMQPLSLSTPKPLLKVNNIPLIVYHIKALKLAGITEIVINVSYEVKKFYDCLGDGSSFGVNLHYSHEPEPLEWGGGIIQTLDFFNQRPFLAISADVYTNYPINKLVDQAINYAYCVLVNNPEYHALGDFGLNDGYLSNRLTGLRYNYAGIGVFHPKVFSHHAAGKRSFRDVILPFIEQGQVQGEKYSGSWYNIGTMKQLDDLEQQLTGNHRF